MSRPVKTWREVNGRMEAELYAGKVQLSMQPRQHLYRIKVRDEKLREQLPPDLRAKAVTKKGNPASLIVPSVTSGPSAAINKSRFLVPWGIRLAVDYLRAKTQQQGAPTEADFEHALVINKAVLGSASRFGTATHRCLEQMFLGEVDATTEIPAPKNDAERDKAAILGAAQLTWRCLTGDDLPIIQDSEVEGPLTPLAIERPVLSLRHGYIGTMDYLFSDANGSLVLGDFKTSKSVYPEMRLQTAAYTCALEEELAFLTGTEASPDILDRIVVHCPRGGVPAIHAHGMDTYRADLLAFLSTMEVKRWLTANSN